MTMQIRRSACASALAVLVAGPAMADCGIGAGNVSILSNDFPAVRALVENAQTCASDSVSVTANMTSEHRDLQVPALTATPAQYSVAVIANQSITPLLDRDLIRPLDDLIDRFGDGLEPTQLIRSGDETMAVAFMANAQHLFYRADLLEQAGVGSPETLSDVLAAAAAIREQGILEHPVALASGAGWDLAQEFVNLFAGHGGRFFLPGTAEPAVNSDEGLAALSALRALTEFSDPDFLTFNSSAAQSLWEAGEVALMMLWGSRAADILSGEGSVEGVAENTVVASAPIIESTGRPATTL